MGGISNFSRLRNGLAPAICTPLCARTLHRQKTTNSDVRLKTGVSEHFQPTRLVRENIRNALYSGGLIDRQTQQFSFQGFTLMAPAPLYDRFVEPAPHTLANEGALDRVIPELRTLRAKRRPDIRLALRPVRFSDGDALQTYIRGLSPQSRYNRFLGDLPSELPASELARALAANGRDTDPAPDLEGGGL